MIEPFRIAITDNALDDLRRRLELTRLADDPNVEGWDLGIRTSFLRDLMAYWRTGFDWRTQETRLNAYPQFRADVAGDRIHFVHVRGAGREPTPLLLLHGWPATFAELLPLAHRLSDPARYGGDSDDACDVVIPSLPGFGFSDRARTMAMNAFAIADSLAELMTQLGYATFTVQGGDIGAGVATALALTHADRLTGLHLNYIPGSYLPPSDRLDDLSDEERESLRSAEAWFAREGAYAHLQRTLPQTVAHALNDSPAGLAAWIVEKYERWSDCGGVIEQRFTRDELLTNVSIYWFTETIASSMRYYAMGTRAPLHFARGQRVTTPTAIARFPSEQPFPALAWIERGYDVVRFTEMARGGHFAAAEEPALLAADILSFVRERTVR